MALRHHLLTGLAIASLTLSCKDKPAENAVDAAPSAPADAAVPVPPPPAMSASVMPETAAEPHGRGHGGPGAMLFAAARKLDLKDDQKAKIDAAEKAAHGGGDADGGGGGGDGGGGGTGGGGGGGGGGGSDGMKEAVKGLHTELIAEIKAGKIDSAKLEPKYVAVEKVAAIGHDREAVALNGLYAALDAPQRKAVVADVRAKQAAREAKMAERMAASDAGADGGKGGGGWMAKRALEHLTNGLDLDADQQKKVDAISAKEDAAAKPRPDMAEMKKNVESLLDAFEKDGFDAKKQAAFSAKNARAPMEQEARLLAQLVPILKPEQRDKLAAKMEKPPSPTRRQGPGMGHRPLLEQDEDDD